MTRTRAFNLQTSARQNILDLEPYRCARDDYDDNGSLVLLDANENAHDPNISLQASDGHSNGSESGAVPANIIPGLNRYPDPYVYTHSLVRTAAMLTTTQPSRRAEAVVV